MGPDFGELVDESEVRDEAPTQNQRQSPWWSRVSKRERAYRLRFFRLVIGAAVAGYLGYALILQSERAIVANSVTLLILGLSWLIQNKTSKDRLAAHVMLFGGFFVLFMANLGDGMLKGSGFWHMPLLSLGAGFLLGTRSAVAWALVGLAAIAVQSYLHFNFHFERDYPNTQENVLAMRMFGIVVAACFGYLSRKTTRERVRIKRLKMQEIQVATAKAEAANRAKSNFLAQVSHELRTPMNGIMGMTQFLQQRSALPQGAKEHVETIERCSSSLLGLFQEILDLSRVESSDWTIQQQPVDLVAVVRGVGDLFGAQANNERRELRITCQEESFWFLGDAVRLSQVLANLVGNAVKFCEQGVIELEIGIEASPDALDGSSHQVQIIVRDEGVGMSESQEFAVFNEFVQLKSRTTGTASPGTGLGLVISREIMRKMGGSLEVTSSIDMGSAFTIALDVRACPAPSASASMESSSAQIELSRQEIEQAKLRVLVVDDLAINRRVACLSLKRMGCEVEEAEDGNEAVEMANKKAYDCIFMDLRMPNKDGFDATLEILKDSTCNRATPIIALSASAFDEDKARCLQVGMVDHVAKPFRSVDLQEVLQTHVVDTPRCTQSWVQEVARAA